MTRAEAMSFFVLLYRGENHLPGPLRDDKNGVWSVSACVGGCGMSSFDYDELSRLVFIAHDRCTRAWITSGGPRHIRIWIQARERGTGFIGSDHPTIEDALAKFRDRDGVPWPRVFADREASHKRPAGVAK